MSLELEVLVPDGVVIRTRVRGVRAADSCGAFGLRPGHRAFVTQLVPCVLSYDDEAGAERFLAVDGGVLLLEDDRVSVVSREAVAADRLEDMAPAAAAMLEARQREEHLARAEFAELQTVLLRELRKMDVKP